MPRKPLYSNKIKNTIISLIEEKEGMITQRQICSIIGVNEDTFCNWKNNISDFSESIKIAKEGAIEKRKKRLLILCEDRLEKLISGYDYDEKKIVTVNDGKGNPKIKEQTISKKHIAPSLGAIIHFQTNRDTENWRNKQSMEVTGKDGKDLIQSVDLSKLSDSELSEYHKLIQKASGK